MAIEITTILLGACFGAALVLYAAPRGYLGHPHRRISATSVALTTSESGQTSAIETVSPSVPAVEAAPSPAPAAYETVQPERVPSTPVSSVVSFGSSTTTRVHRYRRRSAPVRASSKAAHRNRRR